MMGLDKPQQHAKFLVAGSIYYGNIRQFVFKTTNSVFEPLFGGVRGNVQASSIARRKACSRLPIRDD